MAVFLAVIILDGLIEGINYCELARRVGNSVASQTRLVSIVRLLVLPGKAAGLAMDGKAM